MGKRKPTNQIVRFAVKTSKGMKLRHWNFTSTLIWLPVCIVLYVTLLLMCQSEISISNMWRVTLQKTKNPETRLGPLWILIEHYSTKRRNTIFSFTYFCVSVMKIKKLLSAKKKKKKKKNSFPKKKKKKKKKK